MKFFAIIRPKSTVSTSWKIHDIRSAIYKGVRFELTKGDHYESLELSEENVAILKEDVNIILEAVSVVPSSPSL